jgi:hypothetical protein
MKESISPIMNAQVKAQCAGVTTLTSGNAPGANRDTEPKNVDANLRVYSASGVEGAICSASAPHSARYERTVKKAPALRHSEPSRFAGRMRGIDARVAMN